MKVITYLYKNNPVAQHLTLDDHDGESGSILLNDILEARDSKKETLLIKLPNGYRLINPTEIVDLTIDDIHPMGAPHEIQ